MYKITWDKETGGVLLHSRIVEGTLGVSPRPVFFEELDLLKLNELGWEYPHSIEPLLWAVNKQYWYQGELMFEAKGANIYDAATIVFQPGREKMTLKPVNVGKMLAKNHDFMFLLESEAIEFIRETFSQYAGARKSVERVAANQMDFEALAKRMEKKTKQKMAIVKEDCDSFEIMPLDAAEEQGKKVFHTTKIDRFLASFSGGKDSQVVLDLCTRAIPSTEFEVIYSDTGYELPPSLLLYEQVQEHYHKLFPDLKFSMARNHESVLNYWDKIGTPSDTHRWCCSVMKTGPLYRSLKLNGSNKQARVLTFDGIRSEESTRRSNYNRIGKGVKHDTVINASPILSWSSVEIFFYLWQYDLPINPAYRCGMTRVGCLICPFSSEWNDMISSRKYAEQLSPFLSRIEAITRKSGVKDVDVYIKEGNWKRRAGGRGMDFPSSLVIEANKPHLKMTIHNPQVKLPTWLNAVGKYTVFSNDDGSMSGELKYNDKMIPFTITNKEGGVFSVVFENTYSDPVLQGLIKRVFYKATYCIHCGVCEVECPTGALVISPQTAHIDKSKCISCNKCLNFHDFGCISAASLAVTGTKKDHKMKLISYNNFGMNEGWVEVYFSDPDAFFNENLAGLNVNEQMPSFAKWLHQAGIISDTKGKQITPLGSFLAETYMDNPDLVWQIIWINLSYNSPIAAWYNIGVEWGKFITQQEMEELVLSDYSDNSKTTVHNVVYAFVRTLKESPLGEMGLFSSVTKNEFQKKGFDTIEREALAYSLYKYSEAKGVRSLRISDLFSPENNLGAFREFGIAKSNIEKLLRSLNSDANRVLIAELNMGLESITLREDLDSISCLKTLIG
ncbi:MAG: phosphoadenosine phosphosulfate reductase family protein [Bacteroidaceae bacterium]|nr:phosphoadenosine phosphosulfate reductase family protein [Bacteroidaceae bacterium]